jgi:hypothetical protein
MLLPASAANAQNIVPAEVVRFENVRVEGGPDATKQFGACEMQAIEKMNYQQGDWSGPAGRYLYACMRAAGFDLRSDKTPAEGYCTFGDMRRIVLPECYQPIGK